MQQQPQRAINPECFAMEAETQLLGAILLDSNVLSIAREIVKDSDFYSPANMAIFGAMCELENKSQPINIATLYASLANNVAFKEAGAIHYLMNCESRVPSAILVETYANLVRNDSIRRKVDIFRLRITDVVKEQFEDADAIVAQLSDELLSLTNGSASHPWSDFKDSLQQALEALCTEGEDQIIPTGFVDLDSKLTGLRPGTLTIVAARPAMGKTAFGLNILSHVGLRCKLPVAFFSLEMTSQELINRILSSIASINGNSIRQKRMNDEEWNRLLSCAEKYSEAQIYIDETPGIDIVTLQDRAKRLYRQNGIRLIIVDYLQLMHADNRRIQNREQEVATISRGLKGIAKELKIPVVALAQLNRALDSRTEKRPILSDLRESGSIEQDSDCILFIHREDYYRPNQPQDNTAEIIIAKQRSGPTGIIKLHWAGEYTRFSNLEYKYTNGADT